MVYVLSLLVIICNVLSHASIIGPKNNTPLNMHRFQKDFSAIILDEIALEGLDGITIEGKNTT